MPTNAIGADTCNLALNLPKAERAIWGKLATAHGVSIGAFLKRLALKALEFENPSTALQIREIRMRRQAAFCLLLFSFTLIFSDRSDFRRARRPAGRVRTAATRRIES